MQRINKEEFIEKSREALGSIVDVINGLPGLRLQSLDPSKTALVIVDMINGFAREGALMSARVEALIPAVTEISKACAALGIEKLAFADCHNELSPEFESYPPHCLAGTSEAEMVEELKELGGFRRIPKSSTNGFLEEEFQKWLEKAHHINTFIVTGDCTDICIEQFAVTLKTWFTRQNRKVRVIVPVNAVDTYDLGAHNGDLMHVMALYSMMGNGVELVDHIE